MYNTSVQLQPTSQYSKSAKLDNQKQPTVLPITDDSFYVINQFNHDSGIAEGTPPLWFGPVDVLRLYVQYPSASWVILNEVSLSDTLSCSTDQRSH